MKNILLLIFGIILCLVPTVHGANDLTPLFAAPTEAEIDAVLADWSGRDVAPYNWQVVGSGTLGGFDVDVVSHEVAGNTHYGAVRYPADYDPTQSYGILTVNHGGTNGVNVAIVGGFTADCLSDKFIVVPSFRGETLATGGLGLGNLVSGGEISEFDGDIDDVLALVNGTIANYAGARATDQMVFGGSRGGGVSYLMSIRDPRITRAVYFYGATDHMTYPGLQARIEQLLASGAGSGPFYATVLRAAEPYQDGEITLAEARHQLLMRSSIHFLSRLPDNLQLHHGAVDFVVPVEHSQRLDAALTVAMLPIGDYDYFEYPEGGHGNNMPNSTERRDQFLCSTHTTTAVELSGREAVSADSTSMFAFAAWIGVSFVALSLSTLKILAYKFGRRGVE